MATRALLRLIFAVLLNMSPTNLQGLNLVAPTQPSESFPADSQDSQDLLNLSYFPELSAQLDIWTNLAFESDEPLVHLNDKKAGGDEANNSTQSVEDDEEDDPEDGQPAQADNHDNVATADPVPPRPTQPRTVSRPLTAFDIGSLLAGFGVDPFVAPPVQSAAAATPSLAQILSLYPNAVYPPPPAAASGEHSSQSPAAKRARVRRQSASTSTSDQVAEDSAPSQGPVNNTPLTAAEDKRRRNTAASARFRLKKKEREAALEKTSKELETRVTELERECEGLRRENGWLKGLVVGVTGAGVGATQQAAPATAGVKRRREEVNVVGK